MVPLLTWVDRGPIAAGVLAALLLLLGLTVPPFLFISSAVVAFVSLRSQAAGIVTTVGLATVLALCVVFAAGLPVQLITYLASLSWGPVIFAASVLRITSNLPAAIGVVSIAGVLTGLLLLVSREWLSEVWQASAQQLQAIAQSPQQGAGENTHPIAVLTLEQITELLQVGVVAYVIWFALVGLFLARSGQAKMFNPGGFQLEFHSLFFGKQVAGVCIAVLLIGMLVGGAFGGALVIAALFPLVLQGLAVVHSLVKQRSMGIKWLVGMYLLMMIFYPVTLFMTLLGCIDNFRRLPRQ